MRGFGIMTALFPGGLLRNMTHMSLRNPDDNLETPEVFPILSGLCIRHSATGMTSEAETIFTLTWATWLILTFTWRQSRWVKPKIHTSDLEMYLIF